jgi:acetylornithine/succinyldiaminopimelate/putrescine aminotransferase
MPTPLLPTSPLNPNVAATLALGKECLMPTIVRRETVLTWGQGVYLGDSEGKTYLDLIAGFGVNGLGYAHPVFQQAVLDQLSSGLVQIGASFPSESQALLAQILTTNFGGGKAFFCSSGTEANDGALKLAFLHAMERGISQPEVIATSGSFHGRTVGGSLLTGQPKYHRAFAHMTHHVRHVPYGNIARLESAITPHTAVFVIEPIQGEGGVIMPTEGYLKAVRKICTERNILLWCDEVQTGIGRTGRFYAYQHEAIQPDIITLAKILGAGFPIGAIVATDAVSAAFKPGDHGATYGGNPLATAVGLAVVREIGRSEFLTQVRENGVYFRQQLLALETDFPKLVFEARGLGLMLAFNVRMKAAPLAAKVLEAGAIVNGIGTEEPGTIRLLPPLIITREEIDKGIEILRSVLATFPA